MVGVSRGLFSRFQTWKSDHGSPRPLTDSLNRRASQTFLAAMFPETKSRTKAVSIYHMSTQFSWIIGPTSFGYVLVFLWKQQNLAGQVLAEELTRIRWLFGKSSEYPPDSLGLVSAGTWCISSRSVLLSSLAPLAGDSHKSLDQ